MEPNNIEQLRRENKTLLQQNEQLHTCWGEAQKRASVSANRCINLIADISERDARIKELEQRLREIEQHLNPSEQKAA